MENTIAELKTQIAKLTAEVSKMKLEHAEDRVFNKAVSGDVKSLADQVQNLDKMVEIIDQKAEVQPQVKATEKAKEMSLTEIAALYRKDPVAGRKAMEAQGMQIEVGSNPWQYTDKQAQIRIEESDPELAARLKSEAQAAYAASIR